MFNTDTEQDELAAAYVAPGAFDREDCTRNEDIIPPEWWFPATVATPDPLEDQ